MTGIAIAQMGYLDEKAPRLCVEAVADFKNRYLRHHWPLTNATKIFQKPSTAIASLGVRRLMATISDRGGAKPANGGQKRTILFHEQKIGA